MAKDKTYPKGLPPGFELGVRTATLETEKVFTAYFIEKNIAYLREEIVYLCTPKRKFYIDYHEKSKQVSRKKIDIPNPKYVPCHPNDDECYQTYLSEPDWLNIGKTYNYHLNGKIERESCHHTIPEINHENKHRNYLCFEESSVHTPKCNVECSENILIMQPGKYPARQNTGIYAAPDFSSKELLLLHKNEVAEVMETRMSLHKLNSENAFWVKVKVNGKEGYMDCSKLLAEK